MQLKIIFLNYSLRHLFTMTPSQVELWLNLKLMDTTWALNIQVLDIDSYAFINFKSSLFYWNKTDMERSIAFLSYDNEIMCLASSDVFFPYFTPKLKM